MKKQKDTNKDNIDLVVERYMRIKRRKILSLLTFKIL